MCLPENVGSHWSRFQYLRFVQKLAFQNLVNGTIYEQFCHIYAFNKQAVNEHTQIRNIILFSKVKRIVSIKFAFMIPETIWRRKYSQNYLPSKQTYVFHFLYAIKRKLFCFAVQPRFRSKQEYPNRSKNYDIITFFFQLFIIHINTTFA